MQFDLLHLGTFVLAAHLLGTIAACHAILHTRTSQGAIAWAVSLVAMPYFTLIPYLFLGRSKFAGYIDERRQHNDAMRQYMPDFIGQHAHDSPDPSAERLANHASRALTALSGMAFVAGNQVRLLIDGTAAFAAIFAAIDQASAYVIVQFFIVRDDRLGRQLQDKLIAKAAQGVRVYFLYDSIGSFDLPRHYTRALSAAGVEVHAFATHRRFVNRFQLNFRNHRKIVVVDGERAFVGGLNVGVEYLGEKPPLAPWRDTHIELHGPVVAQVQYVFVEDWNWATRRLPKLAMPQRDTGADMHCQVVASGPADKQETCSLFFVEAINAARRRIWITTPYLVPDEAVFAALRLAVMRGVEVRILIPARPDHRMVFEASKLYAYDAVCAGIQVFRYQPGFVHQKVVLIDDSAAAIGSANLDNRSFRLNFEIMVLTVDPGFAAEVQAMLTDDFAQGQRVEPTEYTQSAAWHRIAMHVARLFGPIL
jgi:cardiolipin synthase